MSKKKNGNNNYKWSIDQVSVAWFQCVSSLNPSAVKVYKCVK